jgi:hypothetical protein
LKNKNLIFEIKIKIQMSTYFWILPINFYGKGFVGDGNLKPLLFRNRNCIQFSLLTI